MKENKKNMKENKKKSPFVDRNLLISELNKFLTKYNTSFHNKSDKISQLFEVKVYNDIVKFYRNENYEVKPENLIDNKFKYKLSPNGIPTNFSHFKITKKIRDKIQSFEIHHNMPIETSFDQKLFLTPDISVIKENSIEQQKDKRFYNGNRVFHYVSNSNLVSFIEVKNYTPFPELLFNFIGLIYTLHRDLFELKNSISSPKHFAPMLVISGIGNYHTEKIKETLMNNFNINIIFELFYKRNQLYKKNNLKKIGTSNSK